MGIDIAVDERPSAIGTIVLDAFGDPRACERLATTYARPARNALAGACS